MQGCHSLASWEGEGLRMEREWRQTAEPRCRQLERQQVPVDLAVRRRMKRYFGL